MYELLRLISRNTFVDRGLGVAFGLVYLGLWVEILASLTGGWA